MLCQQLGSACYIISAMIVCIWRSTAAAINRCSAGQGHLLRCMLLMLMHCDCVPVRDQVLPGIASVPRQQSMDAAGHHKQRTLRSLSYQQRPSGCCAAKDHICSTPDITCLLPGGSSIRDMGTGLLQAGARMSVLITRDLQQCRILQWQPVSSGSASHMHYHPAVMLWAF